MPAIKAFIKNHPVTVYAVLTFAVSWGGVLWVIGGPSGIPADAEQSESLITLVVIALEIGPIAVGLILTGLYYGKEGFRRFLSRLLRWRAGIRWYAVALLTAPLLMAATLFALSLASPEFLPGILTTQDKASLLMGGIMAGLVGGFFEEPGWTGFATLCLRRRYGIFAAGLILGLLWGAWHFIVAFWGSGSPSGAFSMPLFLAQFAYYITVLPAYRILMMWVYDRTESLLVAMLMHISLTASVLFIFMPLQISPGALLAWYLVMAAVLWVFVVVAAVTGRFRTQASLS